MNDFCIQNMVKNTGAKSPLSLSLYIFTVLLAYSDAEYNLLQLSRKSRGLNHLLH